MQFKILQRNRCDACSGRVKLFIIPAVLVLIGVVAWLGVLLVSTPLKDAQQPSTQAVTTLFAPEIEVILDKKISQVMELLSDPVFVNEVRKANEVNQDISFEEILELDRRWRAAEGVDAFIQPFLANEIAVKLREFQEENVGFSEIFVTDMRGLNVGQTNKTTDYYQADENWWVGAYNAGKGRSYHGQIEFDESAQTEAISLYLPIIDPADGKIIGVAKAVVDITAIKIEL